MKPVRKIVKKHILLRHTLVRLVWSSPTFSLYLTNARQRGKDRRVPKEAAAHDKSRWAYQAWPTWRKDKRKTVLQCTLEQWSTVRTPPMTCEMPSTHTRHKANRSPITATQPRGEMHTKPYCMWADLRKGATLVQTSILRYWYALKL